MKYFNIYSLMCPSIKPVGQTTSIYFKIDVKEKEKEWEDQTAAKARRYSQNLVNLDCSEVAHHLQNYFWRGNKGQHNAFWSQSPFFLLVMKSDRLSLIFETIYKLV